MRMKHMHVKILAGGFYIAMVAVNFLANGLPINNRLTGEISDAYPNLFAPAGLTFSIWGLIYLLLGGYVVYQFTKKSRQKEQVFKEINPLFIATSIANIAWIFSWHYDYIGLSVFIMAILLFLLVKIADILRMERFTALENVLIRAPFSVYFGWITVATIANITVFLVSVGWNGFGISEVVWTSVVLLVGTLIGIVRMRKDANGIYGLVFVWAYFGILLKHVSINGFGGQYPIIITTIIACLVLLTFFAGRIVCKNI